MIIELFAVLLSFQICLSVSEPPFVHSVTDISQEFSFYMDGRFHRQYLKDIGKDVRNWGSLARLDLTNANLLILGGGNPRIPYSPDSIANVTRFLNQGGTVLVMADGSRTMPPVAAFLEPLGATLTTQRAKPPLVGEGEFTEQSIVFSGGGGINVGASWTPLVKDSKGTSMLATRSVGLGHLILGSRGLFGRKPDASDPINAEWITPFLSARAAAKPIDPKKKHARTWVEHTRDIGPLSLEYHDGTAQFADAMVKEYAAVRPHLVAITGVEPSPGMIKRLLVLPTGGGGFSSGVLIAIGAWWGDYPNQRYPMVELIGHEAGHSWVLPHAEPLWNEPIATWLGIQVGKRMGMAKADETLQRGIMKARRHDPMLNTVDPLDPAAHRDLIWGKSYFVFEELERLYGPGAMGKYFKAKRALINDDRERYTMDDCVAVWSVGVGENLFPWFQSLAFGVDASRTDIAIP